MPGSSGKAPWPRCLGGDGEAWFGNLFVKAGFTVCTNFFYRDVQCLQQENVPGRGEATMLCFNHGNGLSDPMLVMRATKRMVRFIAKDTLWKQPLVGRLVDGAAAVPVQRREEHGDAAENQSSQQGVINAFHQGHIVAVSPEGGSRLRTMLNAPFKRGFLFWAVDAVFQKWVEGDVDFRVSIVPCGLVYLHPFSWRSEAMVVYGTPIVLDVALLRQHGTTDDMLKPGSEQRRLQCAKQCVNWLTGQIEEGMRAVKLEVPPPPDAKPHELLEGDWPAVRLAVVAGRILRQGESCSLPSWIKFVQCMAVELQKCGTIADSVNEYAGELHSARITDAQVKRASEGTPTPFCGTLALATIYLCFGIVFGMLALPIVLPWLPLWGLCFLVEAIIVGKGVVVKDGIVTRYGANFDTIAQFKKSFGFVAFSLYLLSGLAAGVWVYTNAFGGGSPIALAGAALIGALAVLPVLWVSMRLCEGCLASFRRTRESLALLLLPARRLRVLCDHRRMLKASLLGLPVAPPADADASAKRRELDWHHCFSAEDLLWGGIVPKGRVAAPARWTGEAGMATPLMDTE